MTEHSPVTGVGTCAARYFRTWRVSGSEAAVGYTSLSVVFTRTGGVDRRQIVYRGDSVVSLRTRCLVVASEWREEVSPADDEPSK